MSVVFVNNVNVSFGGETLLDSVTVKIDAGEKVCLVGRNGTGKSTLLNLMGGTRTPDSGEVSTAKSRIAMLPQEVPQQINGRCIDFILGGDGDPLLSVEEVEAKARGLISRANLDPDDMVEAMSGGQKRRVLLVRAIVGDPDLLLLDEPTNHLDIASIDWMENFLLRYSGAICFVSHDRKFIRALATRVVEIDRGQVRSWPGGLDNYVRRKAEALAEEEAQLERFNKKLAEEETWIRQGIKARRRRNMGRVRELLKLRQVARERRSHIGNVSMKIQKGERTSKKVVTLKNAYFTYGEGDFSIRDFSLTVYRGDKIGIIGPNGCGKTTLIRLLLGKLTPTEGESEMGDNLQIAYLDQLRQNLQEDETVAKNVLPAGDEVIIDGKPKHIIPYLNDFLFTANRANTPVKILSGGERNRLLLAKLFTKPANVLVLDEPTNDLDTETLELLEEKVGAFDGTVLLVSHDREFLNNTVTSSLVFEDGGVREYAGGYDDWLEQRPVPEAKKLEKAPKRKEQKKAKTKLSYKENRELEALPDAIEKLEHELATLHDKVNDPSFYQDTPDEVETVNARLLEVESELETSVDRWTELESLKEELAGN